MFKIYFRITNDIEELKTVDIDCFNQDWPGIEGFIKICFGEYEEGYCHFRPLKEGEIGDELINIWLEDLIYVAVMLSQTQYVAYKEIETSNRWIEFELKWDKVMVNFVGEPEKKRDLPTFITDPTHVFVVQNRLDFIVDFPSFKAEILRAADNFLKEVSEINPELLKTSMARRMLKIMAVIQE